MVEKSAQMLRYAVHASLMSVNHRRFAVRIGIQFGTGIYHLLLVLYEIAVESHTVQCSGLGKKRLVFSQALLADVLLQYYEVAAHFRVGILGKEVVRQTDGGDKMRLLQHFEPYRLIAGRVHHTLGGKKRHDTAVPYRIEAFQEEIVMDGPLGGNPGSAVRQYEGRIKDRNLAERHIGYGKVERTVERLLYLLETLHAYLLIRIEV